MFTFLFLRKEEVREKKIPLKKKKLIKKPRKLDFTLKHESRILCWVLKDKLPYYNSHCKTAQLKWNVG